MMVWGPGAWSGVMFILDHGSDSFFYSCSSGGYERMYSIHHTPYSSCPSFVSEDWIDRSALLLLSWTTFAIYPSCVFCNLRITITPENKHRFCSSLTVESLYDLIVSLDYLH